MDAALRNGADYVGLVFFPKSPRHVAFPLARTLADQARGRAKIVALTVDASDEAVAAIITEVNPDMLQLHGSETVARVDDIKSKFSLPIIKAVKVHSRADIEAGASFTGAADIILFDAAPPPGAVVPGGHGAVFDWSLLQGIAGRFPFMLSGGLNPENVARAIIETGASAVDVSSGVESAPGTKDPERIKRFLQAAKTATEAA